MFGLGKPRKRAVLVVPPKQYDEGELHTLEKEFKHQNIKITRVSTFSMGPVTGMKGESLKPDMKITEVNMENYDGLIFCGGVGAREFNNDMSVHKVIRQANELGKIIGAIDYGPIILAHAEVLQHKCATVLNTEQQKLQAAGAHFTGTAVEIDDNVVTASDSSHAQEFANIASRMMHGEAVVLNAAG